MQMTWRPVGERAQLLADGARRLAADAGVDLVEDQRRRAGLGRRAHQRQHHPRELAAGRGLAQRARRHARVGRDQELDLVGARRPEAVVARRERRRELRAVHRQRRQPLTDGPGQRRRRPRGAPCRAPRPPSSSLARSASSSRLGVLDRLLDARQLGVPGAAGGGVLEHRGDRAAVLALEPVQQRQALLDLVEPAQAPPRRPRRSGAARARGPRPPATARGHARPARPAPRPRRSRTPARPPPTRAPARRRRRPRRRPPARRRRPPRPTAAPRRGAGARARPPARPPPPRSARRGRSPPAPTRAGPAHGRARRRARAARPGARTARAPGT